MSKENMLEFGSRKSQKEKDDKKTVDINDVGIFTSNKPTTAREVIEDMERNGMRPATIEELCSLGNLNEDDIVDTIDLEEGKDYTVENDDSKKPKELNK